MKLLIVNTWYECFGNDYFETEIICASENVEVLSNIKDELKLKCSEFRKADESCIIKDEKYNIQYHSYNSQFNIVDLKVI